ncbi:MAG: tyrosine--tRNA ligase [Dehalococcoidia bacterium]
MTKRDALTPEQRHVVSRGVIEIIPEEDFIEALRSGRKLRLKLGLDPSKPDLHIGHAVLLRKLRLLQDMGHQVVLIVGDWTARIGDPSGQSIMRPMITPEEVAANAETYMRQFFHVVDQERTEVRWQSEWFGKTFQLDDLMRLAARFTVAQMLQREDFRTRYEAHQPLGVHELLYPMLQAYDSVAIEADVEFGGSDQLFNLLVGRELQQDLGQQPQSCFIMKLLVGTDGSQKMSKSLGNTVDFEDPPNEKYGKIMSIPDSALMDYLGLATDIPDEELALIRKQLDDRAVNPMEIKKRLAREIVAQFHGEAAAQEAEGEFAMTYRDHQDGEYIFLPEGTVDVVIGGQANEVNLAKLLVEAALASSATDARRLIRQGAVQLFGEGSGIPPWETSVRVVSPKRIDSPTLSVKPGDVLRVGKHRFLRIVDSESTPTS